MGWMCFLPPNQQCHSTEENKTNNSTTTILRPFFRDYPGEPVSEENFWTLWCKGRLTEADNNHPAGRHSIRTNQCPPPPSLPFFTGQMPFLTANQRWQSTEGKCSSAKKNQKQKRTSARDVAERVLVSKVHVPYFLK